MTLMSRQSTISDDYLKQQQELHKDAMYGVASLLAAPLVKSILEQTGVKSVSDYGAGKCNLRKGLHDLGMTDIEYFPYDPAFPEYGPPKPAGLVCCIDVFEHIEEPYLDRVLLELKSITIKLGFITVHTGSAQRILPDGRNAHLIQKPASWWLPRVCQHFEIVQLQRSRDGFWILTERQPS